MLAVFAGSWLVVAWSVNALSRPLAIKVYAQLLKPMRGRIVQGWGGKASTSAQQPDGSAFPFLGVVDGGVGTPIGKEHTSRSLCAYAAQRVAPRRLIIFPPTHSQAAALLSCKSRRPTSRRQFPAPRHWPPAGPPRPPRNGGACEPVACCVVRALRSAVKLQRRH